MPFHHYLKFCSAFYQFVVNYCHQIMQHTKPGSATGKTRVRVWGSKPGFRVPGFGFCTLYMLYQIVRVFVSCLYTVFKWFPEQYQYYSITLWICSPLLPEHRSAWSESNAVTWCISSRWSIWRGKGFPRSGKRLHWRNRAGCIFCPSSLLLHLPHGSSSSRAADESNFLPLHAG